MPAHWCVDFLAFGKPVLGYVDLPLLWRVPEHERQAYLADFFELATSPRHVLLASDLLLAEVIRWQLGVRIPVLRRTAPHVPARPTTAEGDEVLLSRTGTNGGAYECFLGRALSQWAPGQRGADAFDAARAAHTAAAREKHDSLSALLKMQGRASRRKIEPKAPVEGARPKHPLQNPLCTLRRGLEKYG